MTALAFAPNGVQKPLLSNVIDEWFGSDFIKMGERSKPPCNIADMSDHFLVELSVPGCTKSDFEIEIDDSNLLISTVKKEDGSDECNSQVTSFFTLPFKRSFALGDNIDLDTISAKCEFGVLSIILPKKEDKKSESVKKIPIT